MTINALKSDRNTRFSLYAPSLHAAEDINIPFDRIARQFHSAIDSRDSQRIDRLWNALSRKYPVYALQTCLEKVWPLTHKCLLTIAIENNNTDVVAWLLRHGSEEDGTITVAAHGDTPLHTAAKHDCAAIIAIYHRFLYHAFGDQRDNVNMVDWRNTRGETPLAVATKVGAAEATNVLLSLGASLECSDADGNLPLHHAAAFGHKGIIETLVRSGAAVLAKNDAGYTASELAYSYATDQVLQNAVRSALEDNERNRNKTAPSRLRGTYMTISGYDAEDLSNPATPAIPTTVGIASRATTVPLVPPQQLRLILPVAHAPHPPTMPKVALTTQNGATLPMVPNKDDVSGPPKETSRALQGIVMRDTIPHDQCKDRSLNISRASFLQQETTSPQMNELPKSSMTRSLHRVASSSNDGNRTAPEMVRVISRSSSSVTTPISPAESGLKPFLLRAASSGERYERSAEIGLPRPIPAPPIVERQVSSLPSSTPTLKPFGASPAKPSLQMPSFFSLRKTPDIPPTKRSLKHQVLLADLRGTKKAGAGAIQTGPLPEAPANLPLSPLLQNSGTKDDFISSR